MRAQRAIRAMRACAAPRSVKTSDDAKRAKMRERDDARTAQTMRRARKSALTTMMRRRARTACSALFCSPDVATIFCRHAQRVAMMPAFDLLQRAQPAKRGAQRRSRGKTCLPRANQMLRNAKKIRAPCLPPFDAPAR